jgi:type III restriction enzyme
MKLKFKQQGFQTDAVAAVVECFEGQPMSGGITYRIDPGRVVEKTGQLRDPRMAPEVSGFKNTDLVLPLPQVLKNIQAAQQRQNLPVSPELKRVEFDTPVWPHFDTLIWPHPMLIFCLFRGTGVQF